MIFIQNLHFKNGEGEGAQREVECREGEERRGGKQGQEGVCEIGDVSDGSPTL